MCVCVCVGVCVCVCFRLFEEAATKLNLVGLVGFLQQLRKASQSQLFDSVTETGDYSLAMPGTHSHTHTHTHTRTHPHIHTCLYCFSEHTHFLALYYKLNHHQQPFKAPSILKSSDSQSLMFALITSGYKICMFILLVKEVQRVQFLPPVTDLEPLSLSV